VVKTIVEITRKFSQFPLAGRIVPEFNDENIREWFAFSYRVIYRIHQNVVIVGAMVHGRRMLSID